MLRTLVSGFALAATGAQPVMAENQTWTQIDLAKRLESAPRVEFGVTTELRYQPDGDLDTIEVRPGVSFDVSDALSVSGGYQYVSNRREGPDQREHRLWQEAGYDILGIGDGQLSGRTRLEERWREGRGETGWRLRQQLSFDHPITDSGLSLGFSSEVFIMLNETGWGQTREIQENRARLSIEGDFANGAGWEIGYLNQFENGRNGDRDQTNHHLFLGISADF